MRQNRRMALPTIRLQAAAGAGSDMDAVIRLEGINKIYETGAVSVHAVRDVTAEIQRGEFVAVMGSSGSGKSTLMNILGCLDRPTRGKYLLDGVNVSDLSRNELAEIRN